MIGLLCLLLGKRRLKAEIKKRRRYRRLIIDAFETSAYDDAAFLTAEMNR